MSEKIEFLREHLKEICAFKGLQEELTYDVSLDTLKRVCKALDYLQQENQSLKDKINTYENPEDLTLMFMYCNKKAKDKIKELKHILDELEKWLEEEKPTEGMNENFIMIRLSDLKNKIKELKGDK